MSERSDRSDPKSGRSVPAPDDAELAARLRAGEEGAYQELIQTYGGRLLAVARRILRSEEDARDCVQDAFLSAFRSVDRFEGNAKLGTWLHRIVVNACLMKLRTRRRKPEESLAPDDPQFDKYGFRIGPTQGVPTSADELLVRQEVRQQVRKAIDSLAARSAR